MKTYLIGIDIGGTKVDYLKLDNNLNIIKKKRFLTKRIGGGSLKILDFLIYLIEKEKVNCIKKLGIAINAAVKDNIILKSSVLNVENFDIVSVVKERLRNEVKLDIKIENDVVAATLAEAKLGIGKKVKNFALLNIGTGTRVCYWNGKDIITGHNNMGGEISQLKIYSNEFKKTYLLEELVSGRGVSLIYKNISGENKSAKEIFQMINYEPAKKTINIFKKYLVHLLEMIAYFYNPEVIVLRGSVFNSSALFLNEVIEKFKKNNYSFFHFSSVYKSSLKYANIFGVLNLSQHMKHID